MATWLLLIPIDGVGLTSKVELMLREWYREERRFGIMLELDGRRSKERRRSKCGENRQWSRQCQEGSDGK